MQMKAALLLVLPTTPGFFSVCTNEERSSKVGGVGIFGFGFFLESFSWFCAKQSRRFSVSIFIAVCGFSVSSSMWFSVFVKNTSGFADPISVSFSYFLALISNGRETLKLYRSVSSHGTNSNMLRRAGKCTVGLPKQRQVKVDWYELVWFGSPTL